MRRGSCCPVSAAAGLHDDAGEGGGLGELAPAQMSTRGRPLLCVRMQVAVDRARRILYVS